MSRFQKKPPVWEAIARHLAADVAEGRLGPGDKLPTEAELSSKFKASRHSVRQALKELAETGMVYARRGSGVFVAEKPADYPLGRKVRFSDNLRRAGKVPGKQTISVETRAADGHEAEALGLSKGDPVHIYEAISLADDEPIVYFRSAFPAQKYPDLLDHITYSNSVTSALIACGVEDYLRVSTRIAARRATATQAQHLNIREGDPVLLSIGINTDLDGSPTEYTTSWFAGDRVMLTLDRGDQPE